MRFKDIEKLMLKVNIRKKINKELQNLTSPNKYFFSIPLQEIKDILKKYDIVLLQEDNTEWSGWLLGNNSQTNFTLGNIKSKNSEGFYSSYKNCMLVLTWYKMQSGKYEIVAYIS